MTSRERVETVLNHKESDRVPVDLGGSGQSGIHASILYRLRQELGLLEKPVEICEPYQMLGTVEEDLRKKLGVDVVPLWSPVTLFGTRFGTWTNWTMDDGTPVKMPGNFQYTVDKDGAILVYPQGDREAEPSLKMPKGGSFFDSINRAPEIDEESLDPLEDFKNLYGIISDEDAREIEESSSRLWEETDCAIHYNFGGGGFGDPAIIPGPYEKEPRGIRRLDDWYMAHYLYPDYLKELFSWQTELALKNLEILCQALGDRITSINMSGTDFGGQTGELISTEHFREFYKRNYSKLNRWVHDNTPWKTHIHCCGSIVNILPELIETGFDIYNPVQLSAEGMDGSKLKKSYGKFLSFWGGGVDTQKTLPFGSPEDVYLEVTERLELFSKGGGFIFNTVHNIVAGTPIENVLAIFDALKDFGESGSKADR